MPLEVIERQTTEQWYELSGDLAASEIFPRLLPKSESTWDARDGEIETEHEQVDGPYDGCPQPDTEMKKEIAEFTKSAIAEFHDEALTAAKTMLTALKAGQTVLRGDFRELEKNIMEKAAKELGVAVPWDPVEAAQKAAQIAAEQAAYHAQRIPRAQKRVAYAQAMLDENAAAIAEAKKRNKPKMLAHEERQRQIRVEEMEKARRELESLLAGADAAPQQATGEPA
jgi:hypothetical protein